MADLTNATWLGLDPEELTPEQLQEMEMAQQEPLPPEALAGMPLDPEMLPPPPAALMQAKGPVSARDAYLNAINEDLQSQRKGVDTMSKSITDLLSKGSGGIDFTPLAALADSWSSKGGNALTQAAAASKPMSEEQRMSFASKLQDELQRRRGDLSKAQIEAARADLQYGAKQEEKAEKAKEPNAAEKALDITFAKDAAAYFYSGGKAKMDASLKNFELAIKDLEDNPELTGGWKTKIPMGNDPNVQDITNPELAAVRDKINIGMQNSLREILGPAYTEKEGQDVFKRSFNARLPVEENLRRIRAELARQKNLAAIKDASMRRFVEKGTLKGFKPPMSEDPVETQMSGGPAVGTKKTFGGKTYVFKGGNPKQKENWVAQ